MKQARANIEKARDIANAAAMGDGIFAITATAEEGASIAALTELDKGLTRLRGEIEVALDKMFPGCDCTPELDPTGMPTGNRSDYCFQCQAKGTILALLPEADKQDKESEYKVDPEADKIIEETRKRQAENSTKPVRGD